MKTLLSLLTLLLLTSVAYAYELPEVKDGLADPSHPGWLCIQCHYNLLGEKGAKKIEKYCDNCHGNRPENPRGLEIDIGKISRLHGSRPCIRCHVGNKGNDPYKLTAQDFHRVMPNVKCGKCHPIENGTLMKPNTTSCLSCHQGGAHVVHTDLAKKCPACHGKFGEQYLEGKKEIPKEILVPRTVNEKNNIPAETEYLTIWQLIGRIFNALIKLIG